MPRRRRRFRADPKPKKQLSAWLFLIYGVIIAFLAIGLVSGYLSGGLASLFSARSLFILCQMGCLTYMVFHARRQHPKISKSYYRHVPEIMLLTDDSQRIEVLRLIDKKPAGRYAYVGISLGIMAIFWHDWFVPIVQQILPSYFQSEIRLVTIFLLIGLIFVCMMPYHFKYARTVVREELLRRGIPVCLACGYDLRGGLPDLCPECGGSTDTVADAMAKHNTSDL